ncbi:hypothetical protein OEZ85_007294 [Tetradesmus obliquus]|uniref:Uncharacterized protein n=1 Tax=Tetradesmus obliquus TaxID=3088 RepID=A0ABY8U229_TETOB|nr:hypothetical protein OEZ85_007294 [Tetradesmus obliquus]
MSSEVNHDTAPAGAPGDAAAQTQDKQKDQRVMYSACPNLGAFRWLFMSNKQARVGTGRYAPRALGILSGVMLLAAVPAGLLSLLLAPWLADRYPALQDYLPMLLKVHAHSA